MQQVTVAAPVMIDLALQLETLGVPRAELVRHAGVDPTFLHRPNDRLTGEVALRLWDAAVRLSGDALLGLHVAERYRPAALSVLGYVIQHCRTGLEALGRLARFASLLNDGLEIRIEEGTRDVTVRFVPVAGVDNFLVRNGRQVMETMAAGIVLTLRELTHDPFVPAKVSFRHAAAEPLAEYHRIFRTTVRFRQSDDHLVLARDALDASIPQADRTLLPHFDGLAISRLAELEAGGETSRRVARVIAANLNGTIPDIGEVASRLAMSVRALQRGLSAEGATFQSLLDDARREVAMRQLRVPGATAAEVALLLGYSEASAFTRAFRRWTGQTPSAWVAAAPQEPRVG